MLASAITNYCWYSIKHGKLVPLLWFGPIEGRRFVDAEENQSYWDFVVLAWLPVWVTLYWLPRWLGSS